MIARLFLNLTDYPAFRRFIWKPIYETIVKKIIIPDWQFMNYGYAPGALEEPLILLPEDEVNRYAIRLYHYLISAVEVSGKEILEVGSGRGGGANYICKYLAPEKITGLDIAFNAVKLAHEKHAGPRLKFIQGNAEQLPFANESFDRVLNVESCHAYGSVPAFFNEVKRVLRTGGYFLCTDMRSPNGMQTLKRNLQATGMHTSIEDDITINVLNAIIEEDPLKLQRLSGNIPA